MGRMKLRFRRASCVEGRVRRHALSCVCYVFPRVVVVQDAFGMLRARVFEFWSGLVYCRGGGKISTIFVL